MSVFFRLLGGKVFGVFPARHPLSLPRQTAPLAQGSHGLTLPARSRSARFRPYRATVFRWAGGAKLPPFFAPECFFKTSRCSGRLIFHKEYTVLFAPKRSTFRFAARTLRVQGSQGSPSGGAAEGKTPAQEIAARALEAGNRDLYCIGGMSPCSVRAALRSWWRRAYSS